ncbi:hypothetical protein [Labrenzia sp. OB1]|uniref:hypothetical protein n=1 Tax=Labrenzia sp. OB1 TaxID=1561204 RepID=UPI0007B1FCBB|nr:hypothetical protein [Labrenzia sp. OB1]KZM44084.1 hypothetical protein OA90_27080 [Labrenzia sp. OB1]
MFILEDLNQHSVIFIALTKWVPPLITILIGGLFASILFPRWQDRYTKSHARAQRRLEILEEVARWAMRYKTEWLRLIAISEHESKKPNGLTKTEMDRKQQHVSDRNNARLELSDALCRAEVYFSDKALEAAAAFREWDEQIMVQQLQDLPNRQEFTERFANLVRVMTVEGRV